MKLKGIKLNNNTKEESLVLRISEKVNLDERLEEVAPNTYATDSATDIVTNKIKK